MQLEKPKLQRVYVTVTDAETRKSMSQTVYGSTPAGVIDVIRKALGGKPSRRVDSATAEK